MTKTLGKNPKKGGRPPSLKKNKNSFEFVSIRKKLQKIFFLKVEK